MGASGRPLATEREREATVVWRSSRLVREAAAEVLSRLTDVMTLREWATRTRLGTIGASCRRLSG